MTFEFIRHLLMRSITESWDSLPEHPWASTQAGRSRPSPATPTVIPPAAELEKIKQEYIAEQNSEKRNFSHLLPPGGGGHRLS